jgi:hypothetical protein
MYTENIFQTSNRNSEWTSLSHGKSLHDALGISLPAFGIPGADSFLGLFLEGGFERGYP